MNPLFTPGPFFRSGNFIMANRKMHSVHVAKIEAKNENDIDLFAAAPDLKNELVQSISTLEQLRAYVPAHLLQGYLATLDNGNAAIAKAEGRP